MPLQKVQARTPAPSAPAVSMWNSKNAVDIPGTQQRSVTSIKPSESSNSGNAYRRDSEAASNLLEPKDICLISQAQGQKMPRDGLFPESCPYLTQATLWALHLQVQQEQVGALGMEKNMLCI